MSDPKEKPEAEEAEVPAPPPALNPGKRKADVDPTRFGDWELNGRCIDF